MKIGPYTILKDIGTGTFATVYLVEDRQGVKYALKRLHPMLKGSPSSIKMLQREVRINKKLFSRHIVQIQEYQEYKTDEDIAHCLIMEYIDGVDLGQYIKQKGKVSPEETIILAWQICQGLMKAHEKNIFHLDLKPQNVIVDKNGIAKITDFGLAMAIGLSAVNLSKIGGTPAYTPPEIWNGQVADNRSDLYSLGIIMYEMITESPPFQGISTSVMRQHLDAKPIFIRDVRTSTPHKLALLIDKLLEKKPEYRFQSTQEVLIALEELAASRGINPNEIKDQSLHVKAKLGVKQQLTKVYQEILLIIGTNIIFWLSTLALREEEILNHPHL